MKVSIVGTRGIPANYGGFETFAHELSILLAQKDIDVTVYCDRPESDAVSELHGVKLKYSKTTKSENPLLYYYDTIRKSLKHSDIILVAGTGGSLFYFLNLFRRKIIITNTDGLESRRGKWGFIKKTFIRITEFFAMKWSTALVADSIGIADYIKEHYSARTGSKISVIEYGAPINNTFDQQVLDKYKLEANNYYLVVSRLEPENNVRLIIDGYLRSETQKKLVIVGNKLQNNYVDDLLRSESDSIIFPGGIYNPEELAAVRYSCYAYIHGHSVGGTNPSLLEALGSGNICICHDNRFNREVTQNEMFYFNDVKSFIDSVQSIEGLNDQERAELKEKAFNRIKNYYNWENISEKYIKLFKELSRN